MHDLIKSFTCIVILFRQGLNRIWIGREIIKEREQGKLLLFYFDIHILDTVINIGSHTVQYRLYPFPAHVSSKGVPISRQICQIPYLF